MLSLLRALQKYFRRALLSPPKTMRGTGWSRALATSPQALRAAVRALKGAGGRGELGKVPILAVQPFFVTRRHAAALKLLQLRRR